MENDNGNAVYGQWRELHFQEVRRGQTLHRPVIIGLAPLHSCAQVASAALRTQRKSFRPRLVISQTSSMAKNLLPVDASSVLSPEVIKTLRGRRCADLRVGHVLNIVTSRPATRSGKLGQTKMKSSRPQHRMRNKKQACNRKKFY